MRIEWKDTYKIGDAEIDAQHEEMFKRINSFLGAADLSSQVEAVISLYQHTCAHFKHEENIMRRFSYLNIAAHIAQHEELITRLQQVTSSVADGSLSKVELKSFLSEWTSKHVNLSDAHLSGFLKFANRGA